MDYTIDAAEKIVGRLATEVADMLQGKRDPRFDPARESGNRVTVYNTDRMLTTGRKMEQKLYRHHTGYPGGLKEETLERLYRRDSRLVLRHAVNGMLPKNRLRARMLKNLTLLKQQS
ncbi:MAG: 50S ribosomal protein L13 [Candidatus Sungbacteria bacterium RIFCSPLOWO2_02_FULL_54_10]|uniref:Large ribosomal subunit protein uL13 n=2 Tax=Candidatus Sungiibacteriota TaxID=1817917 RepID=A0A1G2L4W4_9BACT|nr:MAG: 50S ribosomal protein L13 [Candidatus Sungbacteria bacterium RIFCSPHIGHO2_01_FULL_54_26]OHA03644.1 MAG: 50S ribosomal protein L13 [Candidatus Sungbacteria bacterium RIFCSPHIGHO2_02_FULL_53_17]OHA06705.1 MAG: 50S ribosomal protein L13 [Candidatus Sungbacteria bacterium RIFCSPLOWO2_01_FULL_54_21]OHA12007.1 MAG: 50S ribosomal protein L13 [Candidatus Sungbacteria bacterium RIFCSPLOWO2_02_FULL_54_10]